jgi:lipopolysaccharide export system protein LptC
LHQPDGSQWSIKAKNGILYKASEQMTLSGQVTIERPQAVSPPTQQSVPSNILQGGLKIETDKVHIDARHQIAETDDPVRITSQQLRVDALGMKANLQTKTVELLAKVRGTYAPAR